MASAARTRARGVLGCVVLVGVAAAAAVAFVRQPHDAPQDQQSWWSPNCVSLDRAKVLAAWAELESAVPITGVAWVDSSALTLRGYLADLCKNDTPPVLQQEDAEAELAAADVICIADRHDLPPIREWIASYILREQRRDEARGARELGLLLEALPSQNGTNGPVPDPATIHSDRRLYEQIKANWKYFETESYALLLKAARDARVVLIPFEPVPIPDYSSGDGKSPDELFTAMNLDISRRVAVWLRSRSHRRRQVVVLVGAAHLLGSGANIVSQLRGQSLRVVTVYVCNPRVEAAVCQRFGSRVQDKWLVIAPGVLRAPGICDHVLVDRLVPLARELSHKLPR
jgi:hypothetical protein